MNERLNFLTNLKADWLEGYKGAEGEPIDTALIQILEVWFKEHVPNEQDPPFIPPTPEGGIEIE